MAEQRPAADRFTIWQMLVAVLVCSGLAFWAGYASHTAPAAVPATTSDPTIANAPPPVIGQGVSSLTTTTSPTAATPDSTATSVAATTPTTSGATIPTSTPATTTSGAPTTTADMSTTA